MKSISQKAIALSICCAMMLPMALASCSGGHKGEVTKVEDDAVWYETDKLELGAQYNPDDYDYIYQEYRGVINGEAVFAVQGSKPYPQDVDWETFDYNTLQVYNVDYYDLEGNLIRSLDLQSKLAESGISGEYGTYINGFSFGEGVIKCNVVAYSMSSEDSYEMLVDTETGDIISCDKQTSSSSDLDNLSNEGSTNIGDYIITKYWIYGGDNGGNSSYIIEVADADGNIDTIDLRDQFPNEDIYDIPEFIMVDDTNCVFPVSSSDAEGTVFYTLNLETLEVQQATEDYSWLESENLYNLQYQEGVGNILVDQDGIKKVDFDNKELTELFNFNSCNVNRYDISNLSLVDYSEDRIILAGTVWRDTGYFSNGSSSESQMIVLTKADSNPNVGKTILKTATLGYLSYPVCEAICNFNSENPDYFVMIDDTYSIENYIDYSNTGSDTDWEQLSLDAQQEMNNQLSIDLMNGDGPDILLDAMNYSQLNSDDYLLDLTDYISDTTPYFENVFEAAKTNDKLYQLPLSVCVSGIMTNKSNIDDGQIGFTFDQYESFVDEVCNGDDPMGDGKIEFFTRCMNGMLEEFISGKDVDFNNDAFISLAEYVDANVNDVIEDQEYSDDMIYSGGMYPGDYEQPEATYMELSTFGSFIAQYAAEAENMRILGLPSVDGRGPAFQIYNSAAISAETASADGCWQFIETLLSEDIQKLIGYSWNTPVRIDSFESIAQDDIEGYNAQIDEYAQWFTEAEMAEYGIVSTKVDDSMIEIYEGFIESCSRVASEDPAVTSIVREEMPAYFEGQKSLDDVITILNDRVQTFVSERG